MEHSEPLEGLVNITGGIMSMEEKLGLCDERNGRSSTWAMQLWGRAACLCKVRVGWCLFECEVDRWSTAILLGSCSLSWDYGTPTIPGDQYHNSYAVASTSFPQRVELDDMRKWSCIFKLSTKTKTPE